MILVFSFNWNRWQIYLIRSDDYQMTIVAILAALIVYGIYWVAARRKKEKMNS